MSNSVFVDREVELAQLKTFLERAARGEAQVVFIAGEAGAGKSSLVAEFVRSAACSGKLSPVWPNSNPTRSFL